MPTPIRLVQGAPKTSQFLRLFVFFNLAQFWDILALFHKVMLSEVSMTPNGVIGLKGLTDINDRGKVGCPNFTAKNSTNMKHLRCRCLGGMTHYPQTQLSTIPQTQQLQMHVYKISVQLSQCSALVMQSEANQC